MTMALSLWPILSILLVCGSAISSDVSSVLNEVGYCFDIDTESCLVNHAVKVLLNVSYLNTSTTSQDGKAVEDIAAEVEAELDHVQEGRADPVLRTFHRAWKYLIPLLIGVKLKLATFVPMVLAVLTFIAKSAFLSGNLALLLTGLNILLKFWYPKWSEEHHVYHDYQQEGYGQNHQPYLGQYLGQYDSLYKPHRRVAASLAAGYRK